FNILGLPNELISLVFSSLSIKDRWRARVNKKLKTIEAESKYHVKRLDIENYHKPEFIRRIAQQVSVGTMAVRLDRENNVHREILNLIKNFDIEALYMLQTNEMQNNMLSDSFLLDLSKSCKQLRLNKSWNVTPEAFHQLYKNMMENSTKLRMLCTAVSKEQWTSFFELIGIIFRDGEFLSNRDIELYKYTGARMVRWMIFDGNLQITIYEITSEYYSVIELKYHENQESLEEVKNRGGMERIRIDRQ
ncbi:hypothetical protein PENTCL1PPCAC_19411, partial [Pristionchus entomophagus]